MLQNLSIKNLAIIEEAQVEFFSGLNIISGETGAGKSILLESVGLILGERAPLDHIREGATEAVIQGLFNLSEQPAFKERFLNAGVNFDAETPDQLIIRRTLSRSGKHRIIANGTLLTLQELAQLTDGLIDICSQHEHQSLVRQSKQMAILDQFLAQKNLLEEYAREFTAWTKTQLEIERLENQVKETERNFSFLDFQIQEIEAAALVPDEEAALEQKKLALQTHSEAKQRIASLQNLIDDSETALLPRLKRIIFESEMLANVLSLPATFTQNLGAAISEIEGLSLTIHRSLSRGEEEIDNDQALNAISDRLSLIAKLKRKYGGAVPAILETLAALQAQKQNFLTAQQKMAELTAQKAGQEKSAIALAKKLHAYRLEKARMLSQHLSAELTELNMVGAKIEITITETPHLNAYGLSEIEFLAQTNAGQPFKPLPKIASGGELSRILLAIRSISRIQGLVGVFLFDEIDTGIGGMTAFEVGKKLKKVSQHNQVLCITHLAQVAAFKDHHFVVRKESHTSAQGRTETRTQVLALTPDESVNEIARMLGGKKLNADTINNARSLMKEAHGAISPGLTVTPKNIKRTKKVPDADPATSSTG